LSREKRKRKKELGEREGEGRRERERERERERCRRVERVFFILIDPKDVVDMVVSVDDCVNRLAAPFPQERMDFSAKEDRANVNEDE
jgi:hypothetical protein